MNHKSLKPFLEQLEDRWQPALLLQLNASGNLTGIFGTPNGTVILLQTGDNQFEIMEGANDLGTYSVVGNLRVSLGNSVAPAPALVVDLGGFEFGGNMDLTTGNATNGYDVLVSNGTIDGNLNVTTGNGPDSVIIGGEGGVTVDGNTSVNTANGADTVLLTGSTFDGNVTVRGANTFTTDSNIGGFFTFDSSRESLPTTVDTTGSDIAGTAVITTSAAADVVNLGGNVSGNAIVNLGNGANTLNFGAGGDATVLGNMTVTAGSGNDVFNFGGGGSDSIGFGSALIGGNLTIVGGNGFNQATFTNATVLGNSLTYVGGNGVDFFTVNGLTAPGARLTAILGNGNDVVTWNALPVLASAYLDGGYGTNTFNSPNAINFPIILRNFSGLPAPLR